MMRMVGAILDHHHLIFLEYCGQMSSHPPQTPKVEGGESNRLVISTAPKFTRLNGELKFCSHCFVLV